MDAWDGESETVNKLNSLHGSSPKWTFLAISCTAFVHALFFLFMLFLCSESVLNCIWGHVFSLDTDDKVAAKLNLASWQLHMPIGCSTILIRVEGSDGLRCSCSVFLGFSFLFWILLASWQPWHMTKDENVHFLANSDAWKLRSYCNGLIIPKWQSDASARNCYALPEQRLRSLMEVTVECQVHRVEVCWRRLVWREFMGNVSWHVRIPRCQYSGRWYCTADDTLLMDSHCLGFSQYRLVIDSIVYVARHCVSHRWRSGCPTCRGNISSSQDQKRSWIFWDADGDKKHDRIKSDMAKNMAKGRP